MAALATSHSGRLLLSPPCRGFFCRPHIVCGAGPEGSSWIASHPDMRSTLQTHKTNAILHVKERHLYVQRCLLCGQWLATSKIVKTHYKGSHPEEYAHHKQAVKLGTFAGCGSPCLYCGVVTKQPRHQKAQCSVLWQFCILALQLPAQPDNVLCDGSGSGTRRVVRLDSCKAGEGLQQCPPGDGDNDSGQSSLQGSAIRQRQTRSPAIGGQPALHSFWTGGQSSTGRQRGQPRSSLPASNTEGHGPAPATPAPAKPGNKHPGPEAELGLGCLPSAGGTGPSATSVQGLRGLQSRGQDQAHDCPLRAQLLHTLFQTVLQCIKNIKENPEQLQAVQSRGWLTSEGRWVYQRWDPQAQALTVDEGRTPLEHQEPTTLLSLMAQAVRQRDVVHRFNATYPITVDQRNTARFMLEIGLRAKGVGDVWIGLEALQGLAALQVVGMQLRRDGLRRSSLAEDVQKMLHEL